ncbi:hypothetical protein PENDEC_c049G02404 [Penicillium decumbens]|uniref:NWD NACHT-NTPase N-terminal domain-containing protein n=1 Tax=Penicillium decumbens TaxID=69771 RepID=A0A1V6NNK1_PENDC|nr:hypothetical protein PENDEC_c049G02404 [Penicillium decumbens]
MSREERAVILERTGDNLPNDCDSDTPSLWDRAYDALRTSDRPLVTKYEKILSRELKALKTSVASEVSEDQSIAKDDKTLDDTMNQIDQVNPQRRRAQLESIIKSGLQRTEATTIKFRLFGREFIPKERIAEAVGLVLRLKSFVDEAVKASPEASLVWAGVCIVLPLFSNPSTAEQANKDGLTYVVSRIRFFVELERLLLPGKVEENSSVDSKQFEADIMNFYQKVMEFQDDLRKMDHLLKEMADIISVAMEQLDCLKKILKILGQMNEKMPNIFQSIGESHPSPSSTVPFRRHQEHFIKREILMKDLEEKLLRSGSRAALVGAAGIGKPNLAIEYSYLIRERSSEIWVFWVFAASATRFEQSYNTIAEEVQLPGRNDPSSNVMQLVRNWLSSRKETWLLILDNLDDLSTGSGEVTSDNPQAIGLQQLLDNYVPHVHENGRILITTRNDAVASHLLNSQHDIILVPPMQRKGALNLLRNSLGQYYVEKDAEDLIRALDCVPLALAQAAAYIKLRTPRWSIREYLDDFHSNDAQRVRLLNQVMSDPHRDKETSNSVITTWYISFERISQQQSSAADLLSLMSFFDQHSIPDALLLHGRLGGTTEDIEDQKSRFETDVVILKGYCLITPNMDYSFDMHQQVQLSCRQWLKLKGTKIDWEAKAISIMAHAFPSGEFKNWNTCQVLLPHALAILDPQPSEICLLKRAQLLTHIAWYQWETGNYTAAEKKIRESLGIRKGLPGNEDLDSLITKHQLGIILLKQGRYNEAIEVNVPLLEARINLQGKNNSDTLDTLRSIAQAYWGQGRRREAICRYEQVYDGRKKTLGEDHVDTWKSVRDLAKVYWKQGRREESIELYERVMKAQKRLFPRDDPYTLKLESKFATVNWERQKRREALHMHLETFQVQKLVLGKEHPDTLSSEEAISKDYWEQGDRKKAVKLKEKVSIRDVANYYWDQGRRDNAVEMAEKVLDARKRVLSEEHPDTLYSIHNLADYYWGQGRRDDAVEMAAEVVEARKRVLGEDHPDTLQSKQDLTFSCTHPTKLKKAWVFRKMHWLYRI